VLQTLQAGLVWADILIIYARVLVYDRNPVLKVIVGTKRTEEEAWSGWWWWRVEDMDGGH
jgi:hypothetical protein